MSENKYVCTSPQHEVVDFPVPHYKGADIIHVYIMIGKHSSVLFIYWR